MYFNAKISVTIGNKALQTVSNIEVYNDHKDIGMTCKIQVPISCRVQYTDGTHDYLTDYPENLFKSGDAVTVQAWYDGFPVLTPFTGYVYEFRIGSPITIICQDAIYLLDQTTVDISYKSISLQQLITNILKGTNITLVQPILQLQLVDISFRLMSPAAILEWIKKQLGLNITLTGNQLYVNLASNTMSTVTYRTDTNVIQSDLQTPEAVFLQLKVKAWFINNNGTKNSIEVGDPNGQLREVFFYKIPYDPQVYQNLAKEALVKYKQHKYSGTIKTLLYPDVEMFAAASYTDIRYPARNGKYVVVGIKYELGQKGFHKIIKMAFLADLPAAPKSTSANGGFNNLA